MWVWNDCMFRCQFLDVFDGWIFCSLVSVCSLGFWRLWWLCGPVFLTCSADVFTGNPCWCWRLGYWDDLGKGRMEEKFFMMYWGWSQRGEGDHSRFPAIEQGMRLGDWISGEAWLCLWPTYWLCLRNKPASSKSTLLPDIWNHVCQCLMSVVNKDPERHCPTTFLTWKYFPEFGPQIISFL